ncbi:leukocyte antigen CD37-like [Rhea pennata]|uniref:leukocyte antigen CD37-like n=1 Tax=Rhea pennata TaxID=8795 RepID=UPI002E276444
MSPKGCLRATKTFLFLFNLFFFVLGGLLLAFGLWILFDRQSFATALGSALFSLHAWSFVFCGVGTGTMALGFLGCLGALKEIKCLLGLYFGSLLLLLTAQITLGVIVYTQRVSLGARAAELALELIRGYPAREPPGGGHQSWDALQHQVGAGAAPDRPEPPRPPRTAPNPPEPPRTCPNSAPTTPNRPEPAQTIPKQPKPTPTPLSCPKPTLSWPQTILKCPKLAHPPQTGLNQPRTAANPPNGPEPAQTGRTPAPAAPRRPCRGPRSCPAAAPLLPPAAPQLRCCGWAGPQDWAQRPAPRPDASAAIACSCLNASAPARPPGALPHGLCAATPGDVYPSGCAEGAQAWLRENLIAVVGACLGVALAELCLMMLSMFLFRNLDPEDEKLLRYR